MSKIILVACVARKLPFPAPAVILYQSAWFNKASTYAQTYGDCWYILSAKYGLVSPGEFIAPYDLTLKTMPAAERRVWAAQVLADLMKVADPQYDELVFLAGHFYRDRLMTWCHAEGFTVSAPLAHLGIGQQLAWLDRQLKMINKQLTKEESDV